MKKLISISFALLCSFLSFSQEESPSLSIGLDKVLFGKGIIDVELLTTIISEKQGELKNRIVEQEILRPIFENSPFVTKNYAYAVVKELMNERDKNVLKKQVLEHSVNYAVVYGIAEMYLQLNWDDLEKEAGNFFVAIDETRGLDTCYTLIQYNPKAQKIEKLWGEYYQAFSDLDYTGMKLYLMNNVWIESENNILISDHLTNYGVPLTKYGKRFTRKNKLKKQRDPKCEFTRKRDDADRNSDYYRRVSFNHLLLDMVFHAVRNNGKFRERGFFSKPLMFNLHQYREMSTYQQLVDSPLKNKMYADICDFVNSIADYYESFEILQEIMEMDGLTDSFDLDKFVTAIETEKGRIVNAIIENATNLIQPRKLEIERRIIDYNQNLAKQQDEMKALISSMSRRLQTFQGSYLSILQNSEFIGKEELLRAIWDDDMENVSTLSGLEHLPGNVNEREVKEYFVEVEKFNTLYSQLRDSIDINDFLVSRSQLELNKMNMRLLELGDTLANGNESIHLLIIGFLEDQLLELAQNNTNNGGSEIDDSLLQNVFRTFYQIKANYAKTKKLEYVDYLQSELIPELALLNYKLGGKFEKVIRLFTLLSEQIKLDIYRPMAALTADSSKFRVFKKIFYNYGKNHFTQTYLEFFRKLDKLDEMKTYYELLHDVLESGGHSANQDVANAMNIILQNLEKYTEFNDYDDRIDIDVESIILALAEKYGERDKNPLNFYLTVGLNSAFVPYELSSISSTDFPVANFSYASEKIGVRFNIYNWKLRYSYANGETKPRVRSHYKKSKRNYLRDPIVSNLHLVVYGSGLLYQVTNLSTAENVNSTFLGTGLGVQFYNNLNFNISALWPVYKDNKFKFRKGLINVGFDIYFVEYINALNKKRKLKKAEKDELDRELKFKAIENGSLYIPDNKKLKRTQL